MSAQEGVELIAAATLPLAVLAVVVDRWRTQKGLGVRAIQFLAVASFVPGIVILGLEQIIDGSTVAALVGAFVGYLFSNIGEFDRRPRPSQS